MLIVTQPCEYAEIPPKKSFPAGSDAKEPVCNVGDLGSIPGSGRFPEEGNGNPLQYSCLENPMDEGSQSPWGHKESDTTERLHFLSLLCRDTQEPVKDGGHRESSEGRKPKLR